MWEFGIRYSSSVKQFSSAFPIPNSAFPRSPVEAWEWDRTSGSQ